jgi:hypothetical protein
MAGQAKKRKVTKRPRPRARATPRASRGKPATRRTRVAIEPQEDAVDEFLARLKHPRKNELEAVRAILLGASPAIREGIKWNAPSFRTTDWFATLNLRAKGGEERVWLILHTGAKVKATASAGVSILDPAGLLTWLAKDRALVTFANLADIRAKRAALQTLLRAWIRHV